MAEGLQFAEQPTAEVDEEGDRHGRPCSMGGPNGSRPSGPLGESAQALPPRRWSNGQPCWH